LQYTLWSQKGEIVNQYNSHSGHVDKEVLSVQEEKFKVEIEKIKLESIKLQLEISMLNQWAMNENDAVIALNAQ
jgi:hypothetical protein